MASKILQAIKSARSVVAFIIMPEDRSCAIQRLTNINSEMQQMLLTKSNEVNALNLKKSNESKMILKYPAIADAHRAYLTTLGLYKNTSTTTNSDETDQS